MLLLVFSWDSVYIFYFWIEFTSLEIHKFLGKNGENTPNSQISVNTVSLMLVQYIYYFWWTNIKISLLTKVHSLFGFILIVTVFFWSGIYPAYNIIYLLCLLVSFMVVTISQSFLIFDNNCNFKEYNIHWEKKKKKHV